MMTLILSLQATGKCLAMMTEFVVCIKQRVHYWLTVSQMSHELLFNVPQAAAIMGCECQ